MGSLFDVKNFWKKFFDDAYFSGPKNSGEKFFCDTYFRWGNSEMDFSLFLCGSLFGGEFLGKNICEM